MSDSNTISSRTQIIVSIITFLGSVAVACIIGVFSIYTTNKQITATREQNAENYKISQEQNEAQWRITQKQFEQSLSQLIISKQDTLEFLEKEYENNKKLIEEEEKRAKKMAVFKDGAYVASLIAAEIEYIVGFQDVLIGATTSDNPFLDYSPEFFNQFIKKTELKIDIPTEEIKEIPISTKIKIIHFYNSLRQLDNLLNVFIAMHDKAESIFNSHPKYFTSNEDKEMNILLDNHVKNMKLASIRGTSLFLSRSVCKSISMGKIALKSINDVVGLSVQVTTYDRRMEICNDIEEETEKYFKSGEKLIRELERYENSQDIEVLKKLFQENIFDPAR
jgi:hypothetical protein